MADIRLELPSYSENAHFGWEGNRDLPDISRRTVRADYEPQEDPSLGSPAYWLMRQQAMPIDAVLSGTAGLRSIEHLLPQLEHETEASWKRRCSRGVLTPYFQRIVKAACGLLLRKPIQLQGGDQQWWDDWRLDVNRHGSCLEEFCTKVLLDAIAYGHCGWLVDHFTDPGVVTLADQLASPSKPYLVRYEPHNVICWREAAGGAGGHLAQLRLREMVTEQWGSFGQQQVRQVRVLGPGTWATYRAVEVKGELEWHQHEHGETGLADVPFAVVYSQREGLLLSKPPLLEIAQLNLQHYALQAQLLNCLHVAAQPVMVVKGWDNRQNRIDVGVNNALSLPATGDAFYVEPAASAFQALQDELASLESQMANLGIAILAKQKNVAESGLSKQLDRADSHSMLAVISQDLEAALQRSVDWVAQFAGIEAPTVVLDRDFNADPIDAQTIDALGRLFSQGVIDQRTLLELLRRGEVFGDGFDPEAVLDAVDQQFASQAAADALLAPAPTQTDVLAAADALQAGGLG